LSPLGKRIVGWSLQEPGEEEGGEAGRGEEEESAVACLAHRGEHVRNRTSNYKIEKLGNMLV
jgi:hypothetical protein